MIMSETDPHFAQSDAMDNIPEPIDVHAHPPASSNVNPSAGEEIFIPDSENRNSKCCLFRLRLVT